MNSVLVSNGHGKFHMVYAAQAAEQDGLLDRLITAAYPAGWVRHIAEPMRAIANNDRWKRLLMREVDGIPDSKIHSCTLSEMFYQLANRFRQYGCNGTRRPQLDAIALHTYQTSAMRVLKHSAARLYHVRSGYGGKTIRVAKEEGMRVIVDHSIAHPRALTQLVDRSGKYEPGELSRIAPMWKLVEEDINNDDFVLVNSDFVKKTLIDYGVDEGKVLVLYWRIDQQFESFLMGAKAPMMPRDEEVRFLFAGGVDKRKGADILLQVFETLRSPGVHLTIAGAIDPEMSVRFGRLRNPEIKVLGVVRRDQLAQLMLNHDVFVFPTLAEGSARVVFEAMAAGMAIITTTPNAGSVVEHGKHGWLISPGDPEALKRAVQEALDNRELISRYGSNAKELVLRDYHSGVYRTKIVQMYRQLLDAKLTDRLRHAETDST